MTPKPIRLALRRTLARTRHVRVVPPRAATGRVRDVYQQVERDFGMLAPPVALHSPAPEILAGSWMMLRETLVAGGEARRALKEAVAAAVSLANACPYCVEVHSATLGGLGSGPDAEAIAHDQFDDIGEPDLRAVASWARGSGDAVPPETSRELAELIGVAVTFEYLNRMVHVFLEDSPLPPSVPASARKYAHGMLGRFLRPAGDASPGGSLALLPPASLPADFEWASENRMMADAFGRACAAFDPAVVPDTVRDVVSKALAGWDGRPPGLSRAWLEPLVSGLPESNRAVATLALLTAKAPYQVDDGAIEDFRRVLPADAALVECTSWASLVAARRKGVLLSGAAG